MITNLYGRKIGMTQVFDDTGTMVPVTVIQVGPCTVLQVKTGETDGYAALQLGLDEKKGKNTTAPELGHAKKAGVAPPRLVREIPWDGEGEIKAGDKLTVEEFKDLSYVDVVGTTKGRGFAGVVRRHGFSGGPKTHGQSDRHRAPGSIGNSAWPARVWKGMRMAGQYGNVRRTIHGLKVVEVDVEKNLMLVKGAIPGPNGGYVEVRRGLKENVLAHKTAKTK